MTQRQPSGESFALKPLHGREHVDDCDWADAQVSITDFGLIGRALRLICCTYAGLSQGELVKFCVASSRNRGSRPRMPPEGETSRWSGKCT